MCRATLKRATATFTYLALIFVSVGLAGLLKYAVAPATVAGLDPSSFTTTNSTVFVDGPTASSALFYAISDCATRVDAWNPTNTVLAVSTTTFQWTEKEMLAVCIGNYFVYRISFALSVVFMIFSIITKCSPLFHNGNWATKIFLYCFFVVGAFFLPNAFFYGYSFVARIGSFLFLLLQLIIIVDYAFDMHEMFLIKMEACDSEQSTAHEGGDRVQMCCCSCGLGGVKALYLAASFLHLLLAVVGVVLLYVFYTSQDQGCAENVVIITLTLLFGLAITATGVIQCKKTNDVGDDGSVGLLVPSVVFCYCVYYAYDAVKANPNPTCHPVEFSYTSNDAGAILLGLLVSAYSLVWISLRTAQSARGVIQTRRDSDISVKRKKKKTKSKATKKNNNRIERIAEEDGEEEEEEEADTPSTTDAEAGGGPTTSSKNIGVMEIDDSQVVGGVMKDDVDTVNKQIWLFHFVLAMGALYLGMILTQWGGYTGGSAAENEANQATALWVNAVGGWVAYFIFGWIRCAPLICPNRDFRDTRDGF